MMSRNVKFDKQAGSLKLRMSPKTVPSVNGNTLPPLVFRGWSYLSLVSTTHPSHHSLAIISPCVTLFLLAFACVKSYETSTPFTYLQLLPSTLSMVSK